MNLINGYGKPIEIQAGKNINTEAYENNLRPVFVDDFKADNGNMVFTDGCTITDAGLSCVGYCRLAYNSVAPVDYLKVVSKFVYSEGVKLGLFVSGAICYVDTVAKTIANYVTYQESNALPGTATDTQNIPFNFTVGNEYELTAEKRSYGEYIYTIRDSVSGETVSLTTARTNSGSGKLVFGLTVFEGTTIVTKMAYYLPMFGHAKALIVGDSITAGVGVSEDYTHRWVWKILKDYFHYDGVICGVGGANMSMGIQYATELMNAGYSFDYVICALGTNIDNVLEGFGEEVGIETARQNVEKHKATLESYGCKVIWVVPGVRGDSYATELEYTRKGVIAADVDKIRGDYALMTDGAFDSKYLADGCHPNAAGNQRIYEFAKAELELLGV